MVLDLEDLDMVLLDPILAHFAAYTAAFTVMAGLLEQSSYGSGVAAPFTTNIKHIAGHAWSAVLKAAHEMLEPALRRVEADRVAEQRARR